MSWLYSQALVAEYLVDTCSDGAQSAPSSGNATQQAYLSPDKMTAFSRLSRFGMTYKPLTDDRGEELLTSYLAAFPARTLVQPGKEQESTEPDLECGRTWHGSLAKYDPNTSSWKTAQSSLAVDLDESLVIWPRWGSMRNGECWEQPTLERRTKETGSGSWPTPTCQDANKATKKWRTNHQNNLTAAVFNPERMFPTPTVRDHKGAYRTEALTRKDGKSRAFDALPNAVLDGKGSETVTGHLNPTWVEWLMGWPLGWTDLKRLETDKFRQWQQQHGECSSD